MKNIFFIIAEFDDCFSDGCSLVGCSLRWLLNLKKAQINGYFAIFEQARINGYKRKASLMYIDLPQSFSYIITSSKIWKKNIGHVYWFATIIFIHYHLFNNMEEKHRSCVLIYHNYITSIIIRKASLMYIYSTESFSYIITVCTTYTTIPSYVLLFILTDFLC